MTPTSVTSGNRSLKIDIVGFGPLYAAVVVGLVPQGLALMLTVAFATNPATLANLSHIMPIAVGIGILLGIVSISVMHALWRR